MNGHSFVRFSVYFDQNSSLVACNFDMNKAFARHAWVRFNFFETSNANQTF